MKMKRSVRVVLAVLLLPVCLWNLTLLTMEPWDDEESEQQRMLNQTLSESSRHAEVTRATTSRSPPRAIYDERNRLVRQVCEKYGLSGGTSGKLLPGTEGSFYQRQWNNYEISLDRALLFDRGRHLTYCWMHKVASTSWNDVFFQMAGIAKVPTPNLHTAAQRLKPSADQLSLATSSANLRFYFVRHPFERLVSAFVDKFEVGQKSNYMFKVYNPDIASANPDMKNKGQRPTFRQFVTYLLKTPVEKYNDHWIPYWLHCHLCHTDYDVIGYISTLVKDSNFIAEQAQLGNFSLPWRNRVLSKQKIKGRSKPEEYFRNELSKSQIYQLYQIYKLDFEMFGFSPAGYLDEVGEG